MSMLRALDRDGAPRRRRPPALGAHARTTSSSARELRELARAPRPASACTSSSPASTGRMAPADLDAAVPGLARARGVRSAAPATCSTRWASTGSARATASACTWSASSPIIGSGDAEHGEGGAIRFTASGVEAHSDGGDADPRRRRGGRRDAALRLPHGHLPHLRRDAVLRPGPRPAHRQGVRARPARWCAPASTPPRATSRSPCDPDRRTRMPMMTDDREPARAADAPSRSRSSAASSTRSTTRSSPTSATATAATSRA